MSVQCCDLMSLICIVDKSLLFVVIYRMCFRQIYLTLLVFDDLDSNHLVSVFFLDFCHNWQVLGR